MDSRLLENDNSFWRLWHVNDNGFPASQERQIVLSEYKRGDIKNQRIKKPPGTT
jgi:hypothetical protein